MLLPRVQNNPGFSLPRVLTRPGYPLLAGVDRARVTLLAGVETRLFSSRGCWRPGYSPPAGVVPGPGCLSRWSRCRRRRWCHGGPGAGDGGAGVGGVPGKWPCTRRRLPCPVYTTLSWVHYPARCVPRSRRTSAGCGTPLGRHPWGSDPLLSLGNLPWVHYPAQCCYASSRVPPGLLARAKVKNRC